MIGVVNAMPETIKLRRLNKCIRESTDVAWCSADGRVTSIVGMTASHLINTVLMLREYCEMLREEELVQQPPLPEDLERYVKGMTVDEYLSNVVPPYAAMLRRLTRNRFDINNLQRIEPDELESPQFIARQIARERATKRQLSLTHRWIDMPLEPLDRWHWDHDQ